jgi:hypothetical protein
MTALDGGWRTRADEHRAADQHCGGGSKPQCGQQRGVSDHVHSQAAEQHRPRAMPVGTPTVHRRKAGQRHGMPGKHQAGHSVRTGSVVHRQE